MSDFAGTLFSCVRWAFVGLGSLYVAFAELGLWLVAFAAAGVWLSPN